MIDSIDQQPVALLQKNPGQSSEMLGKKLHLGPMTVRRWIKNLEQGGAIRHAVLVEQEELSAIEGVRSSETFFCLTVKKGRHMQIQDDVKLDVA